MDAYRLEDEENQLVVKACGRWNLSTVKEIDEALKADLNALGYGYAKGDDASSFTRVIFDFSNLERIDTAGAFVLTRAIGCHDGFCRLWSVRNAKESQKGLMYAAAQASKGMAPPPSKPWYAPIERIGEGAMRGMAETYDTL
ncbi:MAG: hypothetical protein JKX72_05790, partial [Robiginitomaculum sp.]|nr:hypothetical protein [Robiginitomaculum sp.]